MLPPSDKKWVPGPAILVTAAFIGPGTVLTASHAGFEYGFGLLWATLFAAFAAIVLQEMASRLGIVTDGGLAEALRSGFRNPLMRWGAMGSALTVILFGNCAFQTGNLLGASAGLGILTGTPLAIWPVVVAAIALIIIWIGRYDLLQWSLTVLVALMGILFVASAVACQPDWRSLASGLKPSIPSGGQWAVIGLIGTTVVPYNLFLHASAAARQYGPIANKPVAVRNSLWDTIVAIGIGGVITASLLVSAAVTFSGSGLDSISDIARQLRPSLGAWAERCFGIGIFAAGLTSAITAPIAAALATAGCFGWDGNLANTRTRWVATAVVMVGLVLALVWGATPAQAILSAQVANGLLLPIIALFLIYTLNRSEIMGELKNGWLTNSLAGLVLVITIAIAARQVFSLLPILGS